jgi:hypothetical protein
MPSSGHRWDEFEQRKLLGALPELGPELQVTPSPAE